MASEGGLALETSHSSDFPDEFGRGQVLTAWHRQQGGRHGADAFSDALGQRIDLLGEPGDVGQLRTSQFGNQTRDCDQPRAQDLAVFGSVQRCSLGGPFGIEFMDSPAQPVNRRRALCHKDFAAVN